MKHLQNTILLLFLAIIYTGCPSSAEKGRETNAANFRPNILWIVVEDMSDHWGCYGETTIQTPHIDQLAAEGELFEKAFVTAPVCSPSRSAMVTGMYQTTIGAHNHRSQNVKGKAGGNEAYYDSYQLPDEVPFLPELFQEAGYYTVLGGEQKSGKTEGGSQKLGKSDYNFTWNFDWYDANDWENRQPGQPFFAQIQLKGGKNRSVQVENPVDPSKVTLPPYYPDDEVLRKDWAEYLNTIIHLDGQVQEIMARLEAEGIADSTAVFLFTDHGISHLRGKQYLYEEGMKIPLIVKWPGVTQPGTRRNDLVSHIDIAATSLHMAGIPIPEVMQGQAFYGENFQPREHVFAARDRCDETVDLMRAVRTNRFKYIRNFLPNKPHAQPNQYKDGKEIMQHMRAMYAEGNLKPETAQYFEPTRPAEELYDLESDPFEMNNLAEDPAFQDTLQQMRATLLATVKATHDLGFVPEPIAEVLGKKYGNKYFILQQPEYQNLISESIQALRLDGQKDVKDLQERLNHAKASIRFWAAYGLGNLGSEAAGAVPSLSTALQDESDAVKIAAARALCLMDRTEPALQIMTDNLNNDNLIVGLYAALFIEDLGEPVAGKILPFIQEAQENPYNFTRRVADRMNENLSGQSQ